MRTSEDLDELATALAAAQGEMPNVPKDSTGQVGQQKTRYADLATVTEHIRPILAANGLSVVQGCTDGTQGVVSVTTRLLHKSGQWIEETLSMPTGPTAQAVGSAITYSRRYSLMAILGLAPDDDDGAAASAGAPTSAAKRPAPKAVNAQEKLLQLLVVRFGQHGIRDRAERLAFITKALGRPVESSKDLSTDEITRVLAELPEVDPVADSYPMNDGGRES